MKIELVKEVKPIGDVKYWIIVNDSYFSSLTKYYRDEESADAYYLYLCKLAKDNETEESRIVLKSVEV